MKKLKKQISPAKLKHKLDKRHSDKFYLDPKRVVTKDFYNNPLIKNLSILDNWTCSDKNKAPLDMRWYLKNAFITDRNPWRKFHYLRNKNGDVIKDKTSGLKETNSLVTLDAMNPKNAPELYYCNRAYRMNACVTKVICIDIESTCVVKHPEIVRALWKLPAEYRERSRHDGLHLLMWIPDDFINDKDKYILQVSNIKGPNNLFELINNVHFITLTRKMTTQVKCPLGPIKKGSKKVTYTDPKQRKALRTFLKQLVQFDKSSEEKRKTENYNNESIHFDPSEFYNLPAFDKALAQKALPRLRRRYKGKRLKKSSYNNDMSRYELAVVSRIKWWLIFQFILGYLHYYTAYKFKRAASIKDIDLITAYLASKQLKPRRKWKTKRQGLPWLLYYSTNVSDGTDAVKKALEIRAQNTKKK